MNIADKCEKEVDIYLWIYDVWVARQIIEQFGHRKIGEYISYNTVAIMEKRLTPVDMLSIDCGAGYKCYGKEGTLGAIRLNDMKEFYIN